MKIFSDDASLLQKIITVLVIILAVPIGVNETLERFGGASNTAIMLISIFMAIMVLSITFLDLSKINFYTVFKVSFTASIISFFLVELGFLNPEDHWLRIVGLFIMFGVFNHVFDEWKGNYR